MPTLWNSEVNKAILEQVKVARQDYNLDGMLQFFKKQNLCIQISSRKSKLYKFHIIYHWESFVLFIWYYLQRYFLQFEHHIEILVRQ